MPETVFNALRLMNYDAGNQAFSSGGTLYYLFAERTPGTQADRVRWWNATVAQGGNKPKGLVPQLTYNVVHSGTYNRTTGTINYQGANYLIRLVASGGALVAEAHIV